MNLPNFAAIAKKYAPSIAFKYTEGQLNLLEMGRFISFDLSTADGIEYLNRVGSVGTEVVQALHQAKAQYDLDVQHAKAVVNPSRVGLLKHLGTRGNEDVIRAQLLEVDNYALLCYMVHGGEWPPYLWEVTCPELAEIARNIRSLHEDHTQPKEHKSMGTTINYHSRLGTANGQLTGTITLSINGELAIVDITCPKDDIKVTYNWVTMPERGYDTTVHSLVRWFDDVAAAAVMITVYPDGDRPQTVTVTLEA